jgi:hypothetical protein
LPKTLATIKGPDLREASAAKALGVKKTTTPRLHAPTLRRIERVGGWYDELKRGSFGTTRAAKGRHRRMLKSFGLLRSPVGIMREVQFRLRAGEHTRSELYPLSKNLNLTKVFGSRLAYEKSYPHWETRLRSLFGCCGA